MKLERVKRGYQLRFTDPLTGKRKKKTFLFTVRRNADSAARAFLEKRSLAAQGLPDASGWQMPYAELVTRFLKESPISSDERRERLRVVLSPNPLKLEVGAD